MKLHLLFALSVLALVPLCLLAQEEGRGEKLSDPMFRQQERMFEKLEVLEAWEMTRGSEDVLVGIVDTGFDFFHPELKDSLAPGFYASGAYHTEIYENIAHGTLVASVIVAKTDNATGMAGLAPDCRAVSASIGMIEHELLKLQKEFMKNNPEATLADLQKEIMKHEKELKAFAEKWTTHVGISAADSIRYLVDRGARVINLSLYLDKTLLTAREARDKLDAAFQYAKAKDVVLLVGAGNSAVESEDYPGDDSFVIVVGASTLDDERWEEEKEYMGGKIKQGSNYGKRLAVMAPSENLVVCVPHDERYYAAKDGPLGETSVPFAGAYQVLPMGATSGATPIVTSLAALVRSLRPDLKAADVVEIIRKGCDDIGEEGYDIYTGCGRVNFRKTLELAKGWKE
jgi:thermitase